MNARVMSMKKHTERERERDISRYVQPESVNEIENEKNRKRNTLIEMNRQNEKENKQIIAISKKKNAIIIKFGMYMQRFI